MEARLMNTQLPAEWQPIQKTPEPTRRQREVLEEIDIFREREGRSPTLSELADVLGVTVSTAGEHVEALFACKLLEPIIPNRLKRGNFRLTAAGADFLRRIGAK